MAHVLRPLCVLALLIFTLFTNYKVFAEPTLTREELYSIRDTTSRDILKNIWTSEYKDAVKATDPSLQRSKKRGKRAGIRLRIQPSNTKVPLPGLLLTNAQSIVTKSDELFALVKDRKMNKLVQMICISESWLSSKIPDQQIALDGYALFRKDRSASETGKTIGGGLLVYIDESWSKNNRLIHEYADSSLELMTLKCRPLWLATQRISINHHGIMLLPIHWQCETVDRCQDNRKNNNKAYRTNGNRSSKLSYNANGGFQPTTHQITKLSAGSNPCHQKEQDSRQMLCKCQTLLLLLQTTCYFGYIHTYIEPGKSQSMYPGGNILMRTLKT